MDGVLLGALGGGAGLDLRVDDDLGAGPALDGLRGRLGLPFGLRIERVGVVVDALAGDRRRIGRAGGRRGVAGRGGGHEDEGGRERDGGRRQDPEAPHGAEA